MRILFCAGGSGGGVYPALSIWQELKAEADAVLWVGSQGGMEAALVQRTGIDYVSIPAAGLHGVGLASLPRNLVQLWRGYRAARRIVQDFQPDVMFFTGGYVAVPVALAGRRVPIMLYVPDIEPGLALKTLARFADRIALIAEDSRAYFPQDPRVFVAGHPTRKELFQWAQVSARQHLLLAPDMPVLLVFGGSKGARSINRAVMSVIPRLLETMQVLHITGELDWPEVQAATRQLPVTLKSLYKAFPYLHEDMGAAYAAADLVLSRGGASSIGEFPLFGLPAVIVPYPYAWRYQKVNADFLVRNGAAVMLKDEELPEKLLELISELMKDHEKRTNMKKAMQSLAHPDAARAISMQLKNLVGMNQALHTLPQRRSP